MSDDIAVLKTGSPDAYLRPAVVERTMDAPEIEVDGDMKLAPAHMPGRSECAVGGGVGRPTTPLAT